MLANAVPSILQHVRRLATAGARAVGGLTAGASVLSSAWKGITLFLSPSGKKVGALIAVAALGAAVCMACCWPPHANQAPAASAPTRRAPVRGTVRLGTARYRHGSRFESLAVSADGKLAVTSSGNSPYNPAPAGRFSPARVFDLTDGRCLYSLPNERGSYNDYPEAVSLSPDGRLLVDWAENPLGRSRMDHVYVWNAATGRAVATRPDARLTREAAAACKRLEGRK